MERLHVTRGDRKCSKTMYELTTLDLLNQLQYRNCSLWFLVQGLRFLRIIFKTKIVVSSSHVSLKVVCSVKISPHTKTHKVTTGVKNFNEYFPHTYYKNHISVCTSSYSILHKCFKTLVNLLSIYYTKQNLHTFGLECIEEFNKTNWTYVN